MTMCMEAGPPLLDEMGRGSTKGQRNPTTSAVFILAASRYAPSNLLSFFFFSTVFCFWAICLFSRPLKQGCVLPGQPPGSMARFLRWPRPHHRPIGCKKKSPRDGGLKWLGSMLTSCGSKLQVQLPDHSRNMAISKPDAPTFLVVSAQTMTNDALQSILERPAAT